MAKYLGVAPEHCLWRMSYQNLLLYSATAPSYQSGGKKDDETIDAAKLTDEGLKKLLI